MRILVVEDEVDLADAVADGLRDGGYAVDVAYDGLDAWTRAAVTPYDLILLDLNLPRLDGRELCRRLRAEPREDPVRILMLTGRDAISERVAGLDAGADDYLVKPFAAAELSARVRSLLRRDRTRGDAVLRAAGVELDTARHEARAGSAVLPLTAKEFALLRYLMLHPNQVLSQGQLLEHVWDGTADPFTNTVRVTVMTLRRKLREHGGIAPIETVVGTGYRLRA